MLLKKKTTPYFLYHLTVIEEMLNFLPDQVKPIANRRSRHLISLSSKRNHDSLVARENSKSLFIRLTDYAAVTAYMGSAPEK